MCSVREREDGVCALSGRGRAVCMLCQREGGRCVCSVREREGGVCALSGRGRAVCVLYTVSVVGMCVCSVQRFAAVIMRIRDPRTTALIFSSGKMVCTGAKRWVGTAPCFMPLPHRLLVMFLLVCVLCVVKTFLAWQQGSMQESFKSLDSR